MKALFQQFGNLLKNMFFRDGTVVTAGIRNNAVGAAVVAALLDLDKGTLPSFESGDDIVIVVIIVKNVADVGFFRGCSGQVFFYFSFFPVAENEVDLFHFRKFLWCNLGGAAGDNDFGIGIFLAEFTNSLSALAFGFPGYGAGVDDDDIIKLLELFLQYFRLVAVDAAAEGDDFDHLKFPYKKSSSSAI